MAQKQFFTAQEAADLLGVKPATLYSYVSRGLIRSEDSADKKRTRRYLAEDVMHLVERKATRQNPARSAAQALTFGDPVLESELTLIENNQLCYRGHNAIELAQTATFEAVVNLLWRNQLSEDGVLPIVQIREILAGWAWPNSHPPPLTALQKMQMVLPLLASRDLAALTLRQNKLIETGWRLFALWLWVIGGDGYSAEPTRSIAENLGAAWGVSGRQIDLINQTLIVCADHELNASSFAARVTASADANLYQCVLAGLAALSGFKHGGATHRVAALFDSIGANDPLADVSERLRRGERLHGFHHTLYPAGDPRAAALLTTLEQHYGDEQAVQTTLALVEAVQILTGDKPTIDVVLVTVAKLLQLPVDGGISLFAIGRTAGWVAHAIEQFQTDQLIRPRARYTGPRHIEN